MFCGARCGYESFCGRLQMPDALVVRRFYHASLAFVDEQAGRVLSRMRRVQAEWSNTFVVYLSDHGDALGDHFLWRKGCKRSLGAVELILMMTHSPWATSTHRCRSL
jgi:arylsulfatase A-like enzyme